MSPASIDLLVTVLKIFIAFGVLSLAGTLVLLAIFDGKLTKRAVDGANAPRLFDACADCGEVEPLCTCSKTPRN